MRLETAPDLERVEIASFDERDDAYFSELHSIVAGLKDLKEVSLSLPVEPAQIIQLAKSSSRYRKTKRKMRSRRDSSSY